MNVYFTLKELNMLFILLLLGTVVLMVYVCESFQHLIDCLMEEVPAIFNVA